MKSFFLNLKYFKHTFQLLLFCSAFNINTLDFKASDIKKETQISEEEFSSLYKGYSNMFEEENIHSHLRQFFGLNPTSETNKINYPDLSITNDSRNLRELYDAKLNEMTSLKNRDGVKIESFFKEKL